MCSTVYLEINFIGVFLSHCVSVTETSRSLVFREVITLYSENYTKQINTLCGENYECFYVKTGSTNS
jgi:hypothetical protein